MYACRPQKFLGKEKREFGKALEAIQREEKHTFVAALTSSIEDVLWSLSSGGDRVVVYKDIRDLLNTNMYKVVVKTLQEEFNKLFEAIIESRQQFAVDRVQSEIGQELLGGASEDLHQTIIGRINDIGTYVELHVDSDLRPEIDRIDEDSQAKVKQLMQRVGIDKHVRLRTDKEVGQFSAALTTRLVEFLLPQQATRGAGDIQSMWWRFFEQKLVVFMNDFLQNIFVHPTDINANSKSLKKHWKQLKKLCSEATKMSKKIGKVVAPTWTKTCRDAFIPPQKFDDKPRNSGTKKSLSDSNDHRKLDVRYQGDSTEYYDVLHIERIEGNVETSITVSGTGNTRLKEHLQQYSESLRTARATSAVYVGSNGDGEVLDPIVMCVIPQTDKELQLDHGKRYWNLLLRDIDNEQEKVTFFMFIVVHRKHYTAIQERLSKFESSRGFVCVIVLETECVPDIPQGSWMVDFEKLVCNVSVITCVVLFAHCFTF